MITATIILVMLLVAQGVTRKAFYVAEQPFSILAWFGTMIGYWVGMIVLWVQAIWLAIAPKSWFEKHYITLTQSQEEMNKFLDAIEKELKKEEKEDE